MDHFPRSQLARTLADSLQGRDAFGDASSGLFLAAPRRTGKSTFLQGDLLPELESRKIVAVYCDLWADQKRDPGSLIADAVGAALLKHLGVVARTAKSLGLEELNIAGWMKIDTTKIGTHHGVTLTDALKALHDVAQKPIALIVDEAQHALTSAAGETAMMALKSARDQMNRPGAVNLMLVMSGSDRDKLLRLVNTASAPFYGSSVRQMPDLGPEFVHYVAAQVERQQPGLAPIDTGKLLAAFNLFSCRPQFFSAALGEVLNPLSPSPERCEERLLRAAEQAAVNDELQMTSDFLALRPLEQAVLWRLLEQGARFRPYDADALNFLSGKTGSIVRPPQVQHALETLRNHTPPMAWKSARGEYAINEAMMYEWYQKRTREGTWPPLPPDNANQRPPPLPRLQRLRRNHPSR